jgi:ubiquinol-cytochrome c reductase iron-sulfur subunit
MIDDTLDSRRRFLVKATSALGIVGAGLSTVPFIASMRPSERARSLGGPVEVDISQLELGQMITVAWRGKPIWILRRTPESLARLTANTGLLADPYSKVETQQPPYASNVHRSIKPEYLVAVGLCTHLGCVPLARFTSGALSGLGDDWPGGYFCPCHASKFDLSGRVFKNVPAATNLVVPPHRYSRDTVIQIGIHQQEI